uniref:Uncharacterized protein n=1 Tax=Oryzias latipes TaxID=8090 RepID=A0A3P9IEG1_ORYLA
TCSEVHFERTPAARQKNVLENESHTGGGSAAENWREPSPRGKVGFSVLAKDTLPHERAMRESNLRNSNRRSTALPLHIYHFFIEMLRQLPQSLGNGKW